MACALTNRLVEHGDIVERMIDATDVTNTFCMCVHNNSPAYVQTLIDKHGIPKHQLIRGLIYSIYTFRNDLCIIFFDTLDFPKHSKYDNSEYFVDHSVYCGKTHCMYDYIDSQPYNETNVSQKMLLQMAVAADNVDMFRHIKNTYDLGISYIDIWVAAVNCGKHVFATILKDAKNLRISQRMLIRFMRFQGCHVVDKLGYLHYIFERGIAHLGRRLNDSIIDYCWHARLSNNEYRSATMLVEKYGSHHLVQSTLRQYIYRCMPISILEMIDLSSRIVYKQKHIDMICSNMSFWKQFPKIEYVLVNKLKLQERKHM
jgi:hypothetical protein